MFKRYWWISPISLILCPLLGLLVGGILTYIQPKQYESTTVIQVRPRTTSIELLSGYRDPSGISPTFFPTEFDVVKSQKTLDIVIDDLDLLHRWGLDRDATRDRLQQAIEVTNIKGTDLIEIRVRSASPDEARDLAARLSEAYRERRTNLEMQRTEQALEELRDAVQKQEALVEEKRIALTTIIRGGANKISDKSASDSPSYRLLFEDKVKLETQIETLLKYDGDQLMTYAAGLHLPENIIRTLHPQYLEEKRNLNALKLEGLGDSHPKLKQQKEVVEGMRRDLDEGVVALRETLRAQLELATEQLERLKTDQSTSESDDNPFGLVHPLHRIIPEDSATFETTKNDFETAQRLLEQLKIKLVGEEMQKRITESPLIIHAEPVATESPIYPTLPRNLIIGSASGLLIGLLLPFLIIPILNRRSPN